MMPARSDSDSTEADVRRAVTDLGARSPEARAEARATLLTLGREDLPLVRDAVEALPAILPAHRANLPSIVRHVYLSGEAYVSSGEPEAFLGIEMSQPLLVDDGEGPRGVGVLVQSRLPGFDAYRVFRDGDIILGRSEATERFDNNGKLTSLLRESLPGESLPLRVLRNGRIVDVVVRLSWKPAWNQAAITPVKARRIAAAEAFWDEHFAPLLERKPTERQAKTVQVRLSDD